MATVTCPRCRTRIQAPGTIVRCPTCGVRSRTGIVANALARPAPTGIVEGLPPSPDRPLSALDRLTARLRRWRRIHDYPGGPGDDADCRRLGWLLQMLTFLPFMIGALFVLLTPAIAFVTLSGLNPEVVGVRDVLILTLLIVVPLAVCVGFVYVRLCYSNRDDESA